MLGFNILDIIALIIFIACLMLGIRRGFLRMTFSFFSIIISFYIARALYRPVAAFLRTSTPIYEFLKTRVVSALGLQDIIESYAAQGETVIIYRLPLPQVMLDILFESNGPSARIMPGAVALEDYIGSSLAGICINILAIVLVFILAIMLTGFVARALRIIARLPIIRGFDRLGGVLIGALIGSFAVWTFVTLYLVFFVGMGSADGEVFNNSFVGQLLYNRGLLLRGWVYTY